MAAPRFDDLVKQGGKVGDVAPDFDALARQAAPAAPPVDAPPPEKTGKTSAFGRHFLQGGTANFSDEMLGAISTALGDASHDTLGELGERWSSILAGGGGGLPQDSARPSGYRENRDAFRELNARALEDQPGASLAGGLTGGIALTRQLPAGYLSAAGQGAVSGLGGSEREDVAGMGRDTALGTGLGVAGNYVGNRVGDGLGALRRLISSRVGQGLQAADDLATAQATKDVNKTVNTLRGEAGGAASRASNIASNIEDIPLPETTARTMGALKETLRGQVAALEQRIAATRAEAIANGVNPEDLAGLRAGEFLSKGSKLDKAQQAAKKLAAYEGALATLRGHLDDIALAADDAPALDPYEGLRKARETLRNDPTFIDRQANVLRNSLEDAPRALDEAEAARQVFKEAKAGEAAAIAERKAQLLSPKAAGAKAKHLAIRYGLPALGGYLGAEIGGVPGAAVGAAAGAGARPGLQALLRASRDPGVRTLALRGVRAVGDSDVVPGDGAQLGRALSTAGSGAALARLLGLEEEPPDETRTALIEALRRRKDAP